MRILIICHYYPPLHSIASLRPYAYAKYWTEIGHDVTVLTTFKSHKNLNFSRNGVNVLEQSYWGSKFISGYKSAQEGHGLGGDDISKRNISGKLRQIIGWLRRRYGVFAAERFPEMIWPWYFSGKKYIKGHIHEFDMVLAEYSPPTALMLGAYAKKIARKKIKLVFDYRDSWTVSNYSQPGLPGIRWLERLVERGLLKYADIITCAQVGIANEFIDRGHSKVAVIENGYFDDIPEASDINLSSSINLVYTGSFGGYRSIDFMKEALEIIRLLRPEIYNKISIYILGEGVSNCIHPKIKIIGKVNYSQSLLYQKKATLLFLVESSDEIARFNIPGKFFEYFRYKKPIIAFGPKKDFEIARYLDKHKIGIVSNTVPRDAANAIIHVLENLALYEGSGLELFSRKVKALSLLSLINDLSSK